MTTSIHVFNNGPHAVEIQNATTATVEILPNQGKDFYVYEGHDLIVNEFSIEAVKPIESVPEVVPEIAPSVIFPGAVLTDVTEPTA